MPMDFSTSQALSAAASSSSATSTRRPSKGVRSWSSPSRSFMYTVTVKVVPSPSLLFTSIVPFMRFTTERTMDMPRPVPSTFVTRESLARVNGSNTVFTKSSDMPQPVSENVNS